MTDTWALPQPWELSEMSREQYLAWAHEQQTAGRRLVTHTFFNAYPIDGGDADELWMYDRFVVADYRTGAVLHVFDYEEEQPDTHEFRNLLLVERVLAET